MTIFGMEYVCDVARPQAAQHLFAVININRNFADSLYI